MMCTRSLFNTLRSNFGLLWLFSLCFGFLATCFFGSSASAVTVTADANRFLYNYNLVNTSGNSVYRGWSDPLRYNEQVPFTYLYGVQTNTYPSGRPSGQYIQLIGKSNVSLTTTGGDPGYWASLNKLTVQCAWDGNRIINDSSNISFKDGVWTDGTQNTRWLDITYRVSGHFTSSYSGVSAGSLLSCAIRESTNYNVPFAYGGIDGAYTVSAFADNSSYDSYISYETSDDMTTDALNGISIEVQNVADSIDNQTQAIEGTNESIDNLSDTVDSLNDSIGSLKQDEQNRYEDEKAEESAREEQGEEDMSDLTGTFNFSFRNPFLGLFAMFTESCPVNIPTIAGMIHAESSVYPCWFSSSTRSVLTPVMSISSSVLLFGYIVRKFLMGGSLNGSVEYK